MLATEAAILEAVIPEAATLVDTPEVDIADTDHVFLGVYTEVDTAAHIARDMEVKLGSSPVRKLNFVDSFSRTF